MYNEALANIKCTITAGRALYSKRHSIFRHGVGDEEFEIPSCIVQLAICPCPRFRLLNLSSSAFSFFG